MFVNLKRYGLIGILIIWLFVMILGLVYQKGKSDERLKAETEYNARLVKYNQTLQSVSESNNLQRLKISTLEVSLNNEISKNAKLLNDNNRISRQFTKLYDSSARLSITSSNESDATTSSAVTPDRILQIMKANNLNHLKCIADLISWHEWYNSNRE
jgi:division protein CdvB (Snf7/Vps24/ESCRT-III family)